MPAQAPSPDAQFEQFGNEIANSVVAAVHSASLNVQAPKDGDGPQVFGAGLFDPKALAKQLAITLVPLLIGAIADKVPGISTIELSNYVISLLNERL